MCACVATYEMRGRQRTIAALGGAYGRTNVALGWGLGSEKEQHLLSKRVSHEQRGRPNPWQYQGSDDEQMLSSGRCEWTEID